MIFTRFMPRVAQYAYRWDARSAWLSGLYQGMTIPFFGVIARRMGASELQISLLIAAPFLGHLLSMFVAWHMQNRPKKPYMFWLGALARGMMFFMPFTGAPLAFIAVVIASQFVGCFMLPAYASIMKDAYPDRARGQLMGTVRIGSTVAAMLAGLSTGHLMEKGLPFYWVMLIALGAALLVAHEVRHNARRVLVIGVIVAVAYLGAPYLTKPLDYRMVFPIAGLFGLLSLWMFNHLPEGNADGGAETRFSILDGLGTLFVDRQFGLYSIGFLIFGFGNLLQNPLIPLFQVDELHISDQWVGILAMAASATGAVAYYVWGRILDRRSPFFTVILAIGLWGVTPIIYANAHSVQFLLIASVLAGAAGAGIDLTWMNAVMQFASRENVPRYAALHTFLVGIRGLLAPFVSAWMLGAAHLPLRTCFYVSAAVIWAGFLFMAGVVLLVLLPAQRAARLARRTRVPVA